jgi:glycosyltransferase involved in cell wall biosynthesis
VPFATSIEIDGCVARTAGAAFRNPDEFRDCRFKDRMAMPTRDPASRSTSPPVSGSPEDAGAGAHRAAATADGSGGAHTLTDSAGLHGSLHARPLKIAQIAPLIERVPPRLYGGTERIVSYLTEELVAMGHDVTLFASGQSITSARLVACCERELRLNPSVCDPIPYFMLMLDKVRRMASQFDVLHFHIDQFHFPVFHDAAARTLTTLHGRQDLPDLRHLYDGFPEMRLISVSLAQRAPIPGASFAGNVPHGLPRNLFNGTLIGRGGYLAFLGRISPEKRVDRAVAIARAVGLPLKIAAKVDRVDEDYFREDIAPLLHRPDIEYIGEIDEARKVDFLGEARALLFPIDWPEPFGLAMIEAMACGTPVLAFRRGSVPEVIEDGITGYVVDSVEEAICKIGSLLALDRARVRRRFEQRFTSERMAEDYVKIYREAAARLPGRRDERVQPIVVAGTPPPGFVGETAGGLPHLSAPDIGATGGPRRG